MRYFAVGGDGKTYGPVDVETLRHWIREGRVTAQTELREEDSGTIIKAGFVAELRDALGGAPAGASAWGYPHPPCHHCGQPYDRSAYRVCPNCGAAEGADGPNRLLTGNETGDRILGFVVGFFSTAVYGVGALIALVMYFVLRPNYPRFARSMMAGLATVFVILLGLFAVCVIGFSRIGG